uniref:Ribosomal protein S3 n=1 Tax=Triparma laevis TaxID=1534972 RepID=A0A0K2RWJ4_9STRA|nr:ribosomal protein S3 [Triparma laevis]BAS19179.1 ribosomal protein S3 [Triparma laevis]
MGQKVNPRVFRTNTPNNFWKSNYFSKNREDFTYYLHKTIAIRKYLNTLFERSGLVLNKCLINYKQSVLNIYISFYVSHKISIKSTKMGTSVLKFRSFIRGRKRKSHNFSKSNTSSLQNETQNLPVLENLLINKLSEKKVHNFLISQQSFQYSSFKYHLLQSLLEYSGASKVKLHLENLQNTALKNLKTKTNYRKATQELRSYARQSFFKEAIEIFILISRGVGSARLLARFIAFQIQSTKRHNNFLTFLKRAIFVFTKLKASKFKGIKILISGRFNNAPRAKTRLLQFGRIPLQTMDAQIDYYKTDAFTPSGVFGIKVWICQK